MQSASFQQSLSQMWFDSLGCVLCFETRTGWNLVVWSLFMTSFRLHATAKCMINCRQNSFETDITNNLHTTTWWNFVATAAAALSSLKSSFSSSFLLNDFDAHSYQTYHRNIDLWQYHSRAAIRESNLSPASCPFNQGILVGRWW